MRKLWDRAEQAIVGVLGLQAIALALWQVLSRCCFAQRSIGHTEEVMIYLLIWAIMIMSNQLVRTDVRPDIVRSVVPAGAARWLEMVNCAAAILFCSALILFGWQIVETAGVIDEHGFSDFTIPMWAYYLALPIGGALMLIRYVIRLIAVAGSSGRNPMPPR